MNGIIILVGGFAAFFILGVVLRYGIKVGVALIVLGVILYFTSGVVPSFTSFGSQLFSMLSIYLPSLITLGTGLLPISAITAVAGFALGFFGLARGDSPSV